MRDLGTEWPHRLNGNAPGDNGIGPNIKEDSPFSPSLLLRTLEALETGITIYTGNILAAAG